MAVRRRTEHLLEPGELASLVAPLEVVRQREGELDGCYLASVAARKRWPSRRVATQPAAGRAQRRGGAGQPEAAGPERRPPESRARGQRTPGARKR